MTKMECVKMCKMQKQTRNKKVKTKYIDKKREMGYVVYNRNKKEIQEGEKENNYYSGTGKSGNHRDPEA